MMDFIYELYQNDNFVLYLTIALVILIILFVLVLIFGKRDQKLEETRKLQKIEIDNAFKEEKKEPIKLESSDAKEPTEIKSSKSIFDDTQVLPITNKPETNSINEDNEKIEVTSFKPTDKAKEPEEQVKEVTPSKAKPLIDIEEEKKPINIQELEKDNYDDISLDLEKELSELATIKKQFNDIELPKNKKESEDEKVSKPETKKENKTYKPGPQVFSSVFVNKDKEEKKIVENHQAENTIEKPKINLFTIQDDEEEIELPSLKKDHQETEKAKTIKIDDINGETYNLK